ncbi:MAG: pentapeptide repeat-containing protein [Sedimenticola selenatireducens]|uniref:Pentapeptide repeat-containing protein n=2 Tax=Sedimenticola selenatireducens TaxID=191960 RepID=A0A558DYX6_9GAMM|nr:pentapeptide repeat-containing protein [Sedimenticola selenatireducens]TVT66295.1 MAG: pentapeptide repeat-containing protein [Sedimenticola selenatireducens]
MIMLSRNLRKPVLGIAVAFLSSYAIEANAWRSDIETSGRIKNTTCKYEPEAQCSWAVRIGAQIPGVDMHEASMASMRLDNANLQGANLSRAVLHLANLQGANLMLSNLEHATLHAVNLQNANMMLANLKGANFLDADLSGANLRGANLEGAILIAAKLDGATWTDGRVCAAGSKGECL